MKRNICIKRKVCVRRELEVDPLSMHVEDYYYAFGRADKIPQGKYVAKIAKAKRDWTEQGARSVTVFYDLYDMREIYSVIINHTEEPEPKYYVKQRYKIGSDNHTTLVNMLACCDDTYDSIDEYAGTCMFVKTVHNDKYCNIELLRPFDPNYLMKYYSQVDY